MGERTWISNGDNKWTIADTDGSPNVLSELEYLGLESIVTEIYGGYAEDGGTLNIGYGFGKMDNGTYRDSDYLRDDRQSIFSLSTGNADGEKLNDLWYLVIDYTYQMILSDKTNHSPSMGFLIGYQYWAEKVTMTNGLQEVSISPQTQPLGTFNGLNSTYEFKWSILRIGFQGLVPITDTVFIKAGAICNPWVSYTGEGVWNLRGDFEQNPSFKHEANRGYGIQLDSSLIYEIRDNISVEAGYQYWKLKSGDGTDTTYFSNGAVGATKFNEAISERQGVTIQITYIF